MRYSFKNIRLSIKLIVAVFLIFITSSPIIYLFSVSSLKVVFGEQIAAGNISSSLFVSSVLLNLAAAALSVLLGLLSAVSIWTFFEKYSFKLLF